MQNRSVTAALILILVLPGSYTRAETITQIATMEAAVPNIFSIEFYKDATVLHGAEGVTFTNIDPAQSFVYADGRQENDGKADTGLVCKTNMSQVWYLKVSASTTSNFDLANFKYYLGQPWNRSLSSQADGQLANSAGWYSIPISSTTVYTAGNTDKVNMPFGTLATLSFAINPAGMVSGSVYTFTITYTVSATP